jgi:Putative adhesin
MKTMKIVSSLVLATVLAGELPAQTESKPQQLVVPLSQPDKPCKVKVSAVYGSIKVVGYEGKDVVVDVETEKHSESSTSGGGMKRIGGGGAEVTAQEDDNHVTVSAGLSHVTRMTVKIPQNVAELTVSTVNDGDISVSNVSGQLEINNVNGWIHCESISGSVVANTINGDLIVGFKTIDPKAAMAFSTLNGKIDVTFPADLKANVKLKAEQGDIYSDFDVDVEKGHPTVEKKAEDHMYRINIDDWVLGKIGGGGPELMMKTTQGSVYVRKAK